MRTSIHNFRSFRGNIFAYIMDDFGNLRAIHLRRVEHFIEQSH